VSRTKQLRPNLGALFRTSARGLEIQSYRETEDARRLAEERELAVMRALRGMWSTDLARELGLSPQTIRRRWLAKEIPGIAHGPKRLMIPHEACRLIRKFGLRTYVLMRKTCRIPSESGLE
jgi:transposase-like protein